MKVKITVAKFDVIDPLFTSVLENHLRAVHDVLIANEVTYQSVGNYLVVIHKEYYT